MATLHGSMVVEGMDAIVYCKWLKVTLTFLTNEEVEALNTRGMPGCFCGTDTRQTSWAEYRLVTKQSLNSKIAC